LDGATVSRPETLIVKWEKVCSIHRAGNRIGFSIQHKNESVVTDGIVVKSWNPENPLNIVGINEHSSEFYVQLFNSGSQEYRVLQLKVSSPVMDAEVHGDAKFGLIIRYQAMQTFTVLYKCYDTGEANIEMIISLGLFGEISLAWKKICDFSEPKVNTICVGTKPEMVYDIIRDGVTQEEWIANSTTPMVLDESVASKIFYVYSSNGALLHLLKPIVGIQPRNSLGASVLGTLGDGGVVSDAIETFRLKFRCETRTEAKVSVTLQTKSHHLMQFHFVKKCARRVTQRDGIWTANQTLILFLGAIVLSVGAAWLLYNTVTRPKPRKPSHRDTEG